MTVADKLRARAKQQAVFMGYYSLSDIELDNMAADEIEHLCAEIQRLKDEIELWKAGPQA